MYYGPQDVVSSLIHDPLRSHESSFMYSFCILGRVEKDIYHISEAVYAEIWSILLLMLPQIYKGYPTWVNGNHIDLL